MSVTLAASAELGLDVLEQVQRGLTVSMIMTPRKLLMTCAREETASSVKAKNERDFSFLPVVDACDRILGLYDAGRWFDADAPDDPIGDDFEPFSEALVIGADASIFEFVQRADEGPTRLVVSGHRVAGLISLSDLQALPVRAALFTVITALEMAMAKRIEIEWPHDPDAWLCRLSEDRRADILDKVAKAKSADLFVSEIACSQLSDKATVICKERLVRGSRHALKTDFNRIRDLRDAIAHASSYAETPEVAKSVCAIVRRIFEIKVELIEAVAGRSKTASSPQGRDGGRKG